MTGIQEWYEQSGQGDQGTGSAPTTRDSLTFEQQEAAPKQQPRSEFQKWAFEALNGVPTEPAKGQKTAGVGSFEELEQKALQNSQTPSDSFLELEAKALGLSTPKKDQRLGFTMQQARKQNPDLRAEVFQLQGKTGLPADLIQRNMDLVREKVSARDFNARQFREDFPRLAGLLDNPDNAALAHDDLESLRLLEGTLQLAQHRHMNSTTLGQRVWDRVREGALSLRQSLTALPFVEPIQRGAEAEQSGDFMVARDPITGMPIYASQVTIGQEQQAQFADAATAMGDAAAIEMARRVAPLQAQMQGIEQRPATQAMMGADSWSGVFDAFKEDPLGIIADIGISSTVQQLPSLALIMATRNPALGVAATAGNQYILETGNGVMQYLGKQGVDITDPTAIVQALEDDETATRAVEFAEQRGAVMATAGGLATGLASRMLVPSRLAGQGVGREAANVFAAQPLAQGTLGAGAEGLLQLTQEGDLAPGELFAEFIGEFSGAPIEAGAFAADRFSRTPPRVVEEASRARASQDNAETLEALGQAARDSKLRGRSPDKFRQFVKQMQEGSGIQSVQIPVERWNELFQSAGQDPAEVAAQVTGSPSAYREASATGADLVIPLAEYATTLAPTDLHEQLSQDIRLHPEDMTQREAGEWMANAGENVERYVEDLATRSESSSTAIYNDMLDQLLATGRERSTADQEARITQAVFRTLGERMGQDPAELFRQYNINVTRPLPEVLRQTEGTIDTQLDPLIDRLRAGSTPAKDDEFGSSLRDYLTETGVDLGQTDNEAVKALLRGEEARQAPEDDATTLDQTGRQPRGRISFPQSRRFFKIELLEGADLSTFLHESGHLYLEVLTDLASREDAPQQFRDDLQAVRKWLGAQGAETTTEQHEQWARGFEAYLMEGNAPSPALRGVFARFRAWLVAVYRNIKQLNVELTDDVRAVMDRLVATDEEINSAREEAGYQPLFEDAAAAGMTAKEYEAYRQSAEQARHEAEDDLTRRVMGEYQRETQAWWKEAKAKVRESVAAEINQRPEYVAIAVLSRGKMPDGSPLPEGMQPFKLSKAALVEQYGEPFLKRLPKPYVYAREGGIDHDMAAGMLKFRSGDELIQAMINALPRQKLIEAETNARMRSEYGDMLNDGSIADAALDTVHNDMRAEVMQRELRALSSRSNRPTSPMSAIKAAAQRIIAEKRVRDLRPDLYLRAEQRAAREAFNAVAEGDYRRATEAKQQQLLNHQLYREAREARDVSEQVYREARRFNTRARQERLGKAGQDYREQVNGILERYEFRRVSKRAQDRRESLVDFLNSILPDDGLSNSGIGDQELADRAMEQASDGQRFTITPEMVNEARRVNWQQLSVEELTGVRDLLRMIWRQATLKDELLKNKRYRDLDAARQDLMTTVLNNTKRDIPVDINNPVAGERIKDGFKNYLAEHRKFSSIVRQMDGGQEDGVAWNLLMRPLNEAGDAETLRIREEGKAIEAIFKRHYSAKELLQMSPMTPKQRTFYPEVGQALSKFEVIGIAMNWGNQINRSRVMDGFGWRQEQVTALLNRAMDKRDWDFVQDTLDYLDGFWPEVKALNERLYGIPPERVEASPIATPHGEYRGGYFPIRYNSRISTRTREQSMVSQARAASGGARVANRVQAGFTQSRQQVIERPLVLDPLKVIQDHISEVVHEVTHTEVVLDVARLLKDRKVSELLELRIGRDLYRQLIDRLADIKFGPERARSAMERAMLYLRSGTSVARLGLNVGTIMLQPFGITNSIARLGVKVGYSAMLRGTLEHISNPVNTTRMVMRKSEMMRTRTMTQNRELNEIRNTIERKTLQRRVAEGSMYPMAAIQMIAVDVPTWVSAYRKSIALGDDEATAVAIADQTVLDAQGGGAIKDLAGVQTGNPFKKMLSMFMSYMVTTWNLEAEAFHRTDFQSPQEVMKFAADTVLLLVAPALAGVMLDVLRNGMDDDEELEEKYLKEQVGFLMGMFLGVREFSGIVSGYQYSGPAGTGIVTEVGSFGSQVSQGEVDQALLNAAADTLGISLHLPSGQIKRTADGVWSIYEGDPENEAEAAQMLLFGNRDN